MVAVAPRSFPYSFFHSVTDMQRLPMPPMCRTYRPTEEKEAGAAKKSIEHSRLLLFCFSPVTTTVSKDLDLLKEPPVA